MADRRPRRTKIALVAGVEGMALYINDYRVAGPKPWGGGVVRHTWESSEEDLLRAIRERVIESPGGRGKRGRRKP